MKESKTKETKETKNSEVIMDLARSVMIGDFRAFDYLKSVRTEEELNAIFDEILKETENDQDI